MIKKPCFDYTINLKATGRNLKRLRVKNGYTVKDLQVYFNLDYPQAIYKWEWGETLPSIDRLVSLAKLYHVTIDDILILDGEDFVGYVA